MRGVHAARGQGLRPKDCDDLLQLVLLSLTRAVPGLVYDPARGKFRPYTKAIALRSKGRMSSCGIQT